jgi:hypothetical protein
MACFILILISDGGASLCWVNSDQLRYLPIGSNATSAYVRVQARRFCQKNRITIL